MNNIARKLEIFVIVVIIAFIGIVYAFKQQTVLAPTTNTPASQDNDQNNIPSPVDQSTSQQQVPTTVITYQGQDGKNALDLLKANHLVEANHFSFGDMVSSIDGIAPDSKHFWAMYVNGEFSQVGASAYTTKSTDMIKWEIDALVDTTK